VAILNRGRIDEVYVLMGPSSLSAQLPGTHTMRQNILDTIDRAQDHLLIVGYMLNSEEVFQRVVSKCSTVRVQVHLDRRQTRGDGHASRMANDLAKAGAEVKLHDAFEGSMHAKVIVADEHEAIVGSANFTHSGSHRNLEAGIRLRGPSVAVLRNAMLSMFEQMEA